MVFVGLMLFGIEGLVGVEEFARVAVFVGVVALVGFEAFLGVIIHHSFDEYLVKSYLCP